MDIEQAIIIEHQSLIKNFEILFRESSASKNWRPLLHYCKENFEENHHLKEEVLLFSAVRDDPRIRAGGPMCALYFDSHLTRPSLKLAQDFIQKTFSKKLEPQWSEMLKFDQERNSPLAVPGEDHEAGRLLLRIAEENLLHQQLGTLFELYLEIQRRHFDREENCFLKMCRALIPSEKWNQISADFFGDYKFIDT